MKRESKFLLGGLGLGFLLGIVLTVGVVVVTNTVVRAQRAARARASDPAGRGGTLGTTASDFALEDINPRSASFGRTLRLSEVWERRGVVLNFMASWCGPCRMELPALQSIHGSDLAPIVCVAADEGAAGTGDLLGLVEESGLTVPVLYAEGDAVERINGQYSHQGLPATYLIDPQGVIRKVIVGARPERFFRKAIVDAFGSESVARR